MRFSQAMRCLRKYNCMTQKEVAEKLNMTSQQISDIENNRKGCKKVDATIEMLCKSAKIFGVKPDVFLKDKIGNIDLPNFKV